MIGIMLQEGERCTSPRSQNYGVNETMDGRELTREEDKARRKFLHQRKARAEPVKRGSHIIDMAGAHEDLRVQTVAEKQLDCVGLFGRSTL